MSLFQEIGALWVHNGDSKAPHALLTSGNHSNGFFNGSRIICDPRLLSAVCNDLWAKFLSEVESFSPKADQIFASALGASDLSFELARQVDCKRGFTEPVVVGGVKAMVLKRFDIEPGTRVALFEDVMTTGSTTAQSALALIEKEAVLCPAVGVIINRSGMETLWMPSHEDLKIVSLVDHPMPIWTPEECPLCREGSEAIRPKANWKRLVSGE